MDKQLGMERTTMSSLVPFQPFLPDRNKLRHALSGMVFVYLLFSVLWLCCLRGVRSCGGRYGLGSRLGLLWLFVFIFLFLGFD